MMMNIRLIKYKQIFLRVCTANIDVHASVGIRWTVKTHTIPLLLLLGTPARFRTLRVTQKY